MPQECCVRFCAFKALGLLTRYSANNVLVNLQISLKDFKALLTFWKAFLASQTASVRRRHPTGGVSSRWVWNWPERRFSGCMDLLRSSCQVKRHGGGWQLSQGLPSVDLAHCDLPRRQQRPEQHRRGLGRRQHRLRLDPALELRKRKLTPTFRRGLGLSRLRAVLGEAVRDGGERVLL